MVLSLFNWHLTRLAFCSYFSCPTTILYMYMIYFDEVQVSYCCCHCCWLTPLKDFHSIHFVLFLWKVQRNILSWKEAINKKWLILYKGSKTRHQGLHNRESFFKMPHKKAAFLSWAAHDTEWKYFHWLKIKTFQWTFQDQSSCTWALLLHRPLHEKTETSRLFNATWRVYS